MPDLALLCLSVPIPQVQVWSGAEALDGGVARLAILDVPVGTLSTVPDLDGDGADELSIPAPPLDPTWAEIVPGATLATGAARAWPLIGDFLWYPLQPNAQPVGDMDGDGVTELAVSAWGAADDDRIYVVSGSGVAGGGRLDDAPLRVRTSPHGPHHLSGVWPVGDLDGDGITDLVASFARSGALTLLFGSDDGPMAASTTVRTTELGRGGAVAVTGLGDLDGDGRDEFAVSVRRFDSSEDEDTGVAVIPGADLPSTGSISWEPYLVETGPDSVADLLACDVDGDGLDDLLTPRGWYPGATLPGAPARVALPADDAGRVASGICAGDLDGDGRQDVVVPSFDPRG